MKFASWNVNSIRARLLLIRNFISKELPDIIMLQELKCPTLAFPYERFPEYKCYVWGQKSYNGVAILVKHNIKINEYKQIHVASYPDSRCVVVNLDEISIMSIYVPCGGETDESNIHKVKFLMELPDIINALPHKKLVIGGDFNVTLSNADVEYPTQERLNSTLCREDLRALLKQFLDKTGLTDNFDERKFTWWDYRAPNTGLRIDYIFTRGLTGIQVPLTEYRRMKIRSFDALTGKHIMTGPSDHVPIVLQSRVE